MKKIGLVFLFVIFFLNPVAAQVGKPAITLPGSPGVGGGFVFSTTTPGTSIRCFTIYTLGLDSGKTFNTDFNLKSATVNGMTVTVGGSFSFTFSAQLQGDTQTTLRKHVITVNSPSLAPGTYFMGVVGTGWGMKYDASPCSDCAYPYTGGGITIIGSANNDSVWNQIYTDRYYGFYDWNGAANCTIITGLEKSSAQNIFSVYPIPSTNKFTVSFNKPISNASLKIFNMMGEEVYNEKVSGNQQTINTKLSSGIYFVRVSTEEKQFVQKMVVE